MGLGADHHAGAAVGGRRARHLDLAAALDDLGSKALGLFGPGEGQGTLLLAPLLALKFEGRLFAGHRLDLYFPSIELIEAAENGSLITEEHAALDRLSMQMNESPTLTHERPHNPAIGPNPLLPHAVQPRMPDSSS